MRRILLGIFLISVILSASAGQNILWLEKDHDFGLMKEIAGPRTGVSRFINAGSDTLSIVEVKPSCGCTSATFTEGPIAPGDTALISYTYDPTMRPGRFEKSVKVRISNGLRQSIHIKGNVLGTPESLATLYPVDGGNARLTDNFLNFGELTYGRTPVKFINVYNLSSDTIRPCVVSNNSALSIIPSSLPADAGDIITYSITLDTRKLGQYGPSELHSTFRADNKSPEVPLTFKISVIPDRDELNRRQGARHPMISLQSTMIDAGSVSDSKPIAINTELVNEGNAPLNIYRIYSDSEAIEAKYNRKPIKPGKKCALKLIINPERLAEGVGRHTVTIISDDPLTPVRTLSISLSKSDTLTPHAK